MTCRGALFYLAILLALLPAGARAQSSAGTGRAGVTRQFREALGAAQRGNESQALTMVRALLERIRTLRRG